MKAVKLFSSLLLGIIGGIIGFIIANHLTKSDTQQIQCLELNSASLPQDSVLESPNLIPSGLIDMRNAAQRTVPGVVHVKTIQMGREYVGNPLLNYFFGGETETREVPRTMGFGSGVIVSGDGYIITNNHVISGADKVVVILNDRKEYDAKIIGADPTTDIALLKIESETPLTFVEYGNSDDVVLGEWVLAVGNPYNLTSTVTAGIISAKARDLGVNRSQMSLESFLQTDAAVNPGNSGGALVNARGQLIGINTLIQSPTGAYSGYSFAIPINIARKVVKDLQKYGKVQKAVLGIKIEQMTSARAKELNIDYTPGIYIDFVYENSAAYNAKLKEGDIILAINGKRVTSIPEFYEQLGKYAPGEIIKLKYNRYGNEQETDVTLQNSHGTTNIERSNDGILGAKVEPLSREEARRYRISGGVRISELQEGKFQSAGLAVNYIIIKINDKIITSEQDLTKALNNTSDGSIFVTAVNPQGRIEYFAFSL